MISLHPDTNIQCEGMGGKAEGLIYARYEATATSLSPLPDNEVVIRVIQLPEYFTA